MIRQLLDFARQKMPERSNVDLRDIARHTVQLLETLAAKGGVRLVTIGGEHPDPQLNAFTIVTSSYQRGGVAGVIGVMGPTRMPYQKVIALVEHTSRLVEDLES